jgi:Ca2+-binding EF-hand superfamily protein
MKKLGFLVSAAVLAVAVSGSALAGDNDRRNDRNDYRNGYNDQNRGHNGRQRGVSQQDVIRSYMRTFDRMDYNGDNSISRRELKRTLNKGHNRSNNRGRPNIGHYDGRDGRYDSRNGHDSRNGRYDSRKGHDGRNGRDYNYQSSLLTVRNFNRFDTNGNGYLSRRELRKSVKRAFHRSDRNKNGYLGQREIRDARWFNRR